MTNTFDELIKEVALKHNVVLDRNDPIMILQTVNDRLMKESAVQQKEILQNFKEELEQRAHQWDLSAKEKVEKILTAALRESTKLLSETTQKYAEEVQKTLNKEIQKTIETHIEKPLQEAQNLVLLIISAGAIVSATFMLVGLFLG